MSESIKINKSGEITYNEMVMSINAMLGVDTESMASISVYNKSEIVSRGTFLYFPFPGFDGTRHKER